MLLLLLAGGAAVAAFVVAHREDRTVHGSLRYACPMHPEVTAATPGPCPICRMALEPITSDVRRTSSASERSGAGTEAPFAVTQDAMGLFEASLASVGHIAVSQEMEGPAWLESERVVVALLHDDEIASLLPNERASFILAAAPDDRIAIDRDPKMPLHWDRSLSEVRFRVVDTNARRAARGAGWVKLAKRARQVLAVPTAAVLPSPDGPYVLAASDDHHAFTRRAVEIGSRFRDVAAVVTGLVDHDLVVAKDAFFFDAERRLYLERERGATP